MSNDIREQLAAYAHAAWSAYMAYLFGNLKEQPDGSLVIPSAYAANLQKLIRTPYADLSEVNKDGDREEADKMLAIIGLMDGD